jgi:uncharacterized phage protein gp47/JayE
MANLIFDPATGIVAPDTQAIREEVAQEWIDAFHEDGKPDLNVDSSAPAGQLIDALTAEIESKNADVLFVSEQLNPRVAEGRWQDALGFLYFLTRKKAEPTVVECQLTGLAGTVIPFGSLVTSVDGVKLYAQRAIPLGADGTGQGYFQASLPGPVDVAAHTVTQITTITPGWDSVDNDAAGVTGRDVETRADFEARRAASVAKNAHGSAVALEGALNDLSGFQGVLDCRVLENVGPVNQVQYGVTVPAHGVMVCIFGGNDAEIARIIYEKKGGGADTGYFSDPMLGNATVRHIATDYSNAVYNYRILRPYLENFYIKVTLYAPKTRSDSQAILTKALIADFTGTDSHTLQPRVGLAQTVLSTRFAHAISATNAADGLLDVKIALSTGAMPGAGDLAWADVLDIPGDIEPTFSAQNILFVESAS